MSGPAQESTRSWRDVLEIHPAADLFPMLSRDQLTELGESIKKNGLTHPVVVWTPTNNDARPRYLLDGRNRLDALEAVGIRLVDSRGSFMPKAVRYRLGQDVLHLCGTVVQVDGKTPSGITGTDPYEYVLAVNVHRRHLNAKQKRELIARVLKARPELTDNRVSKLTGTSPKTVTAVRGDLEPYLEFPNKDGRVEASGRKARGRKPSAKPAHPVATPAQATEPEAAAVPSRPDSNVTALVDATASAPLVDPTPEPATSATPSANVTKPADLNIRRILRDLAGINPADLSDPDQFANDLIAQARRFTTDIRKATS